MKSAKEVHDQIVATGARIFALSLGTRRASMFPDLSGNAETSYWVHASKSTPEWRRDLAAFRGRAFTDPPSVDDDGETVQGFANDEVWNALSSHLHDLGYHEVGDIVSDVFEGRITNEVSRIVDAPAHPESQKDGFGHYGWESK